MSEHNRYIPVLKIWAPSSSQSENSKSSTDYNGFGPDGGVALPVTFMRTVPPMKYHDHLLCLSQATMTQEDYEKAVWARKGIDPDLHQEIVKIQCPGGPDGNGFIFEIHHTSLVRSPKLAELVGSEHWLVGSGMVLSFIHDPAVCLLIVRDYLNEGSDCYTVEKLRGAIVLYNDRDRFILIARLNGMSLRFGLRSLWLLVLDALLDMDPLMTPKICIALASMILRKKDEYSTWLREWCLEQVRSNFIALYNDKEWSLLYDDLDEECQAYWTTLVYANAVILTAADKEPEDEPEDWDLPSARILPKRDQNDFCTEIDMAMKDTQEDATEMKDGTEGGNTTEGEDATKGEEATQMKDATEGEDAIEMKDATEMEDATDSSDEESDELDAKDGKFPDVRPNAFKGMMSATKKAARRVKPAAWKRLDEPELNRGSAKAREVMGIDEGVSLSTKFRIGLLL